MAAAPFRQQKFRAHAVRGPYQQRLLRLVARGSSSVPPAEVSCPRRPWPLPAASPPTCSQRQRGRRCHRNRPILHCNRAEKWPCRRGRSCRSAPLRPRCPPPLPRTKLSPPPPSLPHRRQWTVGGSPP